MLHVFVGWSGGDEPITISHPRPVFPLQPVVRRDISAALGAEEMVKWSLVHDWLSATAAATLIKLRDPPCRRLAFGYPFAVLYGPASYAGPRFTIPEVNNVALPTTVDASIRHLSALPLLLRGGRAAGISRQPRQSRTWQPGGRQHRKVRAIQSFPALHKRADHRPAVEELVVNVSGEHMLNSKPERDAYDGAEKDEGERAGHAERSSLEGLAGKPARSTVTDRPVFTSVAAGSDPHLSQYLERRLFA